MLKLLRTLALGAAAAAVVGLWPATAQAQPPGQATTEFQPSQIPGWTITPGVVFGGLYDSNVALAFPAADTQKTASDRLFAIEPYGQAEYLSPRTTFFSGYRGFIRDYATYDELNSIDHTASVSLRELLTRRITLTASDNLLIAPTTDQLELNDVPFQRTGARYNVAAGGIEARLTRTTDFTARYEQTWVAFEHEQTILRGGTVSGLHSDLLRHLTERVAVGGEYTFRWATVSGNTRLLAFQEMGAEFQYRAGPDVTFEVAGGLSHLSDFTQQLARTGPYVRGGVTAHLRRATVGGEFERRYTPSLSFGGTNQSQGASGYIQMPITRKHLYVEGNAAWRKTDPILVLELPLNSLWIRGSAGYAVTRWFRVEAYEAYSHQDTRLTGGQVNRTVIGAQIVVAQPMRIR